MASWKNFWEMFSHDFLALDNSSSCFLVWSSRVPQIVVDSSFSTLLVEMHAAIHRCLCRELSILYDLLSSRKPEQKTIGGVVNCKIVVGEHSSRIFPWRNWSITCSRAKKITPIAVLFSLLILFFNMKSETWIDIIDRIHHYHFWNKMIRTSMLFLFYHI